MFAIGLPLFACLLLLVLGRVFALVEFLVLQAAPLVLLVAVVVAASVLVVLLVVLELVGLRLRRVAFIRAATGFLLRLR